MSKKNSKATRARIHAADLAKERALAAKKQTKQLKTAAKAARTQVAGASGGIKKKVKGIRVKKGVRIKGIKVVDSESKKAALAALKAAAAENAMAE